MGVISYKPGALFSRLGRLRSAEWR